MAEMDDWLEKLKTEFANKQQQKQEQTRQSPQPSGSMDELLSQVREQFEQPEATSSQSETSNGIEELITQVSAEFEQKQASAQENSAVHNTTEEDFLANLAAKFEKKQQRAKPANYQQSLSEVMQREQRQHRRKKALARKAQAWLAKLDPHSDEGIWFEEFSYSYPSRLEAAIDYLEALREVR